MPRTTPEHRDTSGTLFLVTVLPITKSPVRESLTYFSTREYRAGDVIQVPMRGKEIRAFVIECVSAAEQKMGLKRSDFQLRKITPQEPKRVIHDALLRAATHLARDYATTTGAILRSLVTDAALTTNGTTSVEIRPQHSKHEPVVLELPYNERRDTYARLVRQYFAQKKSVYIICPSLEEVEQLSTVLAKGIEHRLYAITGELSVKEYKKRWQLASTQDEPVVVIGTYTSCALPRGDIGLLVLERESARAYALQQKPYLHLRDVVRRLADELHSELLLADDLLTVDSQYVLGSGHYQRFEDRERRDSVSARVRTIEIRTLEKIEKLTPSITRPLMDAIDSVVADGGRVSIYAARKGFGTVLMCGDCGEVVTCPNCNNNLKLVEVKKERHLRCPFCNYRQTALVACIHCSSWKLTTLGITSEQVAADLKRLRPTMRTYILDNDHAKTHKHAKTIRDEWKEYGGVMIGTEMALPYIRGLAHLTAIASLDSLFSFSDWKAHERAHHVLYLLAQSTPALLVQTRHAQAEVVHTIASGGIGTIIEKELTLRKKYGYPPYRGLITIKLQGTPERVRREVTTLRKSVESWVREEHTIPRPRGTVLTTIVLQTELPLPTDLYLVLRSLPPYMAVSTHPESLS